MRLVGRRRYFIVDIGLNFNTTLAWAPSSKRGQPANATDLACRTDVRLAIQLPAPFTKAPRPLVQGAIGVITMNDELREDVT